jgi:hypothetical protein
VNAVRSAFAELAGLFVEDRRFALAIAIWIAAIGTLAKFHALPPVAGGIALFTGLAVVLVASVDVAARS